MSRFGYPKIVLIWMAAGMFLLPLQTAADVIRDGSLGSGPLQLEGPNFIIPQSYGETRGGNLFHSFETFDLNSDQSATFQGNPAIDRILSRVTGPGESLIDGLLRSEIPGADLYLMNPNGVVFGPHAQLDVPGSLHVSSADYLRLGDADRFHANLGQTSTLTTAAPEAFGFLGAPVGGITVRNSFLQMPSGTTLSLVGGEIDVFGGGGCIMAEGGLINVVSAASSGEVIFNSEGPGDTPDVSSFSTLGAIQLANEARLVVSLPQNNSGRIILRSGSFLLTGSSVVAADNGDYAAMELGFPAPSSWVAPGWIDIETHGDIDILANAMLLGGDILLSAGSEIAMDSSSIEATGGEISIWSGSNVQLENGSRMESNSDVVKEGGIGIDSGANLALLNGSSFETYLGDIDVNAASDIMLNNEGQMLVKFGDLRLAAGGGIDLWDGSSVHSAFGNVNINAGSWLGVANRSMLHALYGDLDVWGINGIKVDNATFFAHNGSIRVDDVSTLSLFNGSKIHSICESDSGSIDLFVRDSVILESGSLVHIRNETDAPAGPISITTQNLDVFGGSDITSSTFAKGDGSPLNIAVRNLSVSGTQRAIFDPYQSSIGTFTGNLGASGDVNISAANVSVNGGAGIYTESLAYLDEAGNLTGGPGGNILIDSGDSVTIDGRGIDPTVEDGLDNVWISSICNETKGGNAGDTLIFTSTLTIDGGTIESGSSRALTDGLWEPIDNRSNYEGLELESAIDSLGRGGQIRLSVDDLLLLNGGAIQAGTTDAGTEVDFLNGSIGIVIDAGHSVLLSGRALIPNVFPSRLQEIVDAAEANGALIDYSRSIIPAPLEEYGSLIQSATDGFGHGGPITIRTPSLLLHDGATISTETLNQGTGGDIRIEAEQLSMTADSDIRMMSSATAESLEYEINLLRDRRLLPGLDDLLILQPDLIKELVVPGDAGSLDLYVDVVADLSDARIRAEATEAFGGNVKITGGNNSFFSLLDSVIATEVGLGFGDGGDVSMSAGQIVLNRDVIVARAEGGDGGNIDIEAGQVLISADSIVDASSRSGVSGAVTVATPDVDLESGLSQLPADFLDASALLRPSCQARTSTKQDGSFVVVRRQGLPASPEGLLMAFDTDHGIGGGPPATGVIPGVDSVALLASAEGMAAFRGGDYNMAGQLLEEAAEKCGGDPACRFDALRGVAQSHQAMGRYKQSEAVLRSALEIAELSGDQGRVASALGNLGNAHIALGQPDVAEKFLNRGIAIAKAIGEHMLMASMLNNQGNYHAAQEDFSEALDAYLESAAIATESGYRLPAAQSLANAGRAALNAGFPARSGELLQRGYILALQLPAANEKVYVLIHMAKSWERLAATSTEQHADHLLMAHTVLRSAADLAREMNNDRALSYAMGNMGALYGSENRTAEALYLTRQAREVADRADAPESLYRWLWQEGKLLWSQGRATAAINAYQRAVAILEETRQETASQYGSTEVYFRQAVAPVYLDLADALLQEAGRLNDGNIHAALLLEARRTVEKLKAAELRDYFRDECVVDLEARTTPLEGIAGEAAIVYPVVLEERLELLVSLPSGIRHFTVPITGSDVDRKVQQFRKELLNYESEAYLDTSRQLYDWLVRPYAHRLDQEKVKTLVFVPSGFLGTIPAAAFHDGNDFLVAKFSLAVTPGLSLVDPKPLAGETPRVLLAGISEAMHGFTALPCVDKELEAIHRLYGGKILLNDEFKANRLEKELLESHPSVVHIASHAVFAGDARDSYLLAYDDRIDMDQLSEIIGSTRFRKDPIELLMLSACETAAGDARAALGLSGVAIRAGARSAIGSLWPIADEAALSLVTGFYTHLKETGISKAEALRRAQQKLRESGTFAHPFFWSPFLMINNWL